MASNIIDRLKGTSRVKLALGGLGLLIALVLPLLGITKNIDGPLPIATVVLMAVYALFALGLNIVVGFAGLLDLGFVAFFLFGAYVGAWLMSDFAINVTGRGGAWETLSIHFFSTAKAELGRLMSYHAAWLFDQGRPCGNEANVAKLTGAQVGWEAANQAFQTLGGMAYSKEYPVERIFRDARIAKNIPVAEELVLAHIGTQMLGLPRSY